MQTDTPAESTETKPRTRALTGAQTRVLAAIRNSIDATGEVPKPSVLVRELGLANSSCVAHACKGLQAKGFITMAGMAVNTVKIVDQ